MSMPGGTCTRVHARWHVYTCPRQVARVYSGKRNNNKQNLMFLPLCVVSAIHFFLVLAAESVSHDFLVSIVFATIHVTCDTNGHFMQLQAP